MNLSSLPETVRLAIAAAQDKKASAISVIDFVKSEPLLRTS